MFARWYIECAALYIARWYEVFYTFLQYLFRLFFFFLYISRLIYNTWKNIWKRKKERLYNRLNRYKLEYYSKRILKDKKVRNLTSKTWLVPILIRIWIDRSPLNISILNEQVRIKLIFYRFYSQKKKHINDALKVNRICEISSSKV